MCAVVRVHALKQIAVLKEEEILPKAKKVS
jgi:hypothetical protein